MDNRIIDIIGVKSDKGASMEGADLGPRAIRCAGLIAQIESIGLKTNDCGDVELSDCKIDCEIKCKNECGSTCGLKNLAQVNNINGQLYKKVKSSLSEGHFPLILGGDHSISAGSILSAQKHFRKIGVIWVDAHGDFNVPTSSPTGNIHGMPLSALTGNGPNEILPFLESGTDYICADNAVIISARALDDAEKLRLDDAGVTVFCMNEIDRLGIGEVVSRAIEIASTGTNGIYVSFDLDALDSTVALGVGTPVDGGLTFREARYICEELSSTGKLIGIDMVELNPLQDTANKTGKLAVELIKLLLTSNKD